MSVFYSEILFWETGLLWLGRRVRTVLMNLKWNGRIEAKKKKKHWKVVIVLNCRLAHVNTTFIGLSVWSAHGWAAWRIKCAALEKERAKGTHIRRKEKNAGVVSLTLSYPIHHHWQEAELLSQWVHKYCTYVSSMMIIKSNANQCLFHCHQSYFVLYQKFC